MEINKIYNEDVFTFLNNSSNEIFDLIIIDPPYNILDQKWDSFDNDKVYFDFIKKIIDLSFMKLKKNGSLYIFNTARNSAYTLSMAEKRGLKFRNWITWDKNISFYFPKKKYVDIHETILFFTKGNKNTFNYDEIRTPHSKLSLENNENKIWDNFEFYNNKGKLSTDIWRHNSLGYDLKINNKKMIHPSEKPIKIIEKIIKASSNENDLVLDLFSGTGTTSIAAKKLKRNFVGVEINKKYIDIAKRRLSSIK